MSEQKHVREWEYRVIRVQGTNAAANVQDSGTPPVTARGSSEINVLGDILAQVADDGWELVNGVGESDVKFLFLRRRVGKPSTAEGWIDYMRGEVDKLRGGDH